MNSSILLWQKKCVKLVNEEINWFKSPYNWVISPLTQPQVANQKNIINLLRTFHLPSSAMMSLLVLSGQEVILWLITEQFLRLYIVSTNFREERKQDFENFVENIYLRKKQKFLNMKVLFILAILVSCLSLSYCKPAGSNF